MKSTYLSLARPSIRLEIGGAPSGLTHFGGDPLLPEGFDYPTAGLSTFYDDDVKPRPLHFLAQFDCSELAKFDSGRFLPERGLLSFFYECDSMRWGFDPDDRDSFRVLYFEDVSKLVSTPHPPYEWDSERFEPLGIALSSEPSYPDGEDFSYFTKVDWDCYDRLREELAPYPHTRHKLLGWSDNIQGSMPIECELVSRGHYLGNGHPKLENYHERAKLAAEEWLLLFQLDTVDNTSGQLMFGDCGRIYYYIRREDLAARRFDRVWLVSQCG